MSCTSHLEPNCKTVGSSKHERGPTIVAYLVYMSHEWHRSWEHFHISVISILLYQFDQFMATCSCIFICVCAALFHHEDWLSCIWAHDWRWKLLDFNSTMWLVDLNITHKLVTFTPKLNHTVVISNSVQRSPMTWFNPPVNITTLYGWNLRRLPIIG